MPTVASAVIIISTRHRVFADALLLLLIVELLVGKRGPLSARADVPLFMVRRSVGAGEHAPRRGLLSIMTYLIGIRRLPMPPPPPLPLLLLPPPLAANANRPAWPPAVVLALVVVEPSQHVVARRRDKLVGVLFSQRKHSLHVDAVHVAVGIPIHLPASEAASNSTKRGSGMMMIDDDGDYDDRAHVGGDVLI